jgi:zinc/manganese transport system permease protein
MILAANPLVGIAHMLQLPFMRDALLAGGAIALASGLVGHFVVLRSQVFSADALSHVAFTGALAALALGADLLVGLYASCVLVALAMAALGAKGRPDDTVIGSVFAWILGLGALFLTIYTTSSSGTDATSGVSVLFGSIFGLSGAQATSDAVVALGVVLVLCVIARPLLFASIEDAVAAARGVPVRALGFVFLALVGVTAAAATQAVGALLLLGLIATPAGAAQQLTTRPFRALWLSGAIAVASMWLGLGIAYATPSVPPSFAILAVATASFAAAGVLRALRTRAARRVAIRAPGAGAASLASMQSSETHPLPRSADSGAS